MDEDFLDAIRGMEMLDRALVLPRFLFPGRAQSDVSFPTQPWLSFMFYGGSVLHKQMSFTLLKNS